MYIASTELKPLTLLLGDAAWLLELAKALDEAIADSEDTTVHITSDLASQISRHLKGIVRFASPNAAN